ncbi:AMP-dependent synthetase/ligase [Nocardiopsis mangrovi]|uniref:AMP-dependent synthetase/ligase n=1 Tax=Nocardiopsis mangrovi TaxID=1179818 RepID=A0ABV9DW85_9ACTN
MGELAYRSAGADARADFFSRRDTEGDWKRVSAGEFLTEMGAVAKGLIGVGVGAGDRVVLVCGNRYEWALIAFAVWVVRAVLVPVAPTCSAERLRHILRDCGPAAIVLDDGRHAPVVEGLAYELTDLARTFRLDREGLEAIARPGAYMDSSAVRYRRDEARRDDPASIVYPVTGLVRARGAVLTHGNYLSSAAGLVERLAPGLPGRAPGQESALLRLPLAGVAGHAALVACVLAGVRVGVGRPGAGWEADLRVFKPAVLVSGAELLGQVYARVTDGAGGSGDEDLTAFRAATDLAVEFDRAERKSAWKRMSRAMYEWMYGRVREALGGRVRLVVCVGGGLEERLDRFYSGIGIAVFQAFGTVESGGAFTANAPGERRAGTAGRPLPGVEMRLARDGEVHLRGPGVFAGYWGAPDAGRAAFRDGWLATGFAGEMDSGGYLTVRRRLRAQASLAAPPEQPARRRPVAGPPPAVPPVPAAGARGEAAAGAVAAGAAPEADHVAVLEQHLRAHPLISQAMVIGAGRPYASALVTLIADQLEYWRLVNNRPLSLSREDLAADPDLLREIQSGVRAANRAVPSMWAVRAFHVLAEEFTPRSGLVLEDGRLRRDAVLRAFAEEIDGLYRMPEPGPRE